MFKDVNFISYLQSFTNIYQKNKTDQVIIRADVMEFRKRKREVDFRASRKASSWLVISMCAKKHITVYQMLHLYRK